MVPDPPHSDPPTPHRRHLSLPFSHPLPLAAAHHSTPLSSPTAQQLDRLHQLSHSAGPAVQSGRRASAVTLTTPASLPTSPPPATTHPADSSHEGESDWDSAGDLAPPPLNLARLAPAVVPSRQGSVLSRGLVLKADYRFAATPPESGSSPTASTSTPASGLPTAAAAAAQPVPAGHPYGEVSGASHVREGGLGVWGVAQPTATGVRSLLALLGAKGTSGAATAPRKRRAVAWFVTREEPILYIGGQPYVLREAAHPTQTYSISDRAENLEEIEARLKHDVLREANRYGGLVLIHSEPYAGPLRPSWVSVSPSTVLTARELFAEVRSEGFAVEYYRTPVARDQSPQDGYLDTYAQRIRALPTRTQLVFNCGAGVVRSTFAMSVALLVRRRMLIEQGRDDPYGVGVLGVTDEESDRDGAKSPPGVPRPDEGGAGAARRVLRQQSEQARRDRSLLRLMHVLAKSIPSGSQTTILALLSSQPNLLENLRAALLGNFDIILSLLSTLDDGTGVKKVVDAIVDDCDAMVNLRESIVQHRVRYASLALLDERTAAAYRQSALAALERYFFLVAFASFLSASPPPRPASTSSSESAPPASSPPLTFSAWLKRRPEIKHMITRLRREGAPGHFFIFAPVQDLSAIAKADRDGTGAVVLASGPGGARPGERQGERIGEEWAEQIIRSRSGIILRPSTILKNDQWLVLAPGQSQRVRGAINFRRVPGSRLYGLSQPTEEGIRTVVRQVRDELGEGEDKRIVWIGVREEPLVNINGTPYVLRQQAVSLRNVKSYSGISASRLELLESRLKDDVLSELTTFEGRILVASEADDGSVNPVWEAVEDGPAQVKTLREVMDKVGSEECGPSFRFIRVPITAEKFPEFQDLRDIIEVVTSLDMDTSAVIVNDQLGRGRTTRTLVVIKLLQDWMRSGGQPKAKRTDRQSYVVINNLLRVVRNGFEVKNAVDAAITACGEPFDLLESIDHARQQAEDSEGETRKMWVARGVRELRGYFFLILFMCFLNECRPSTWRELGTTSSYEAWVKERPVFRTIQRELDDADIEALTPLSRGAVVERGTASNDEVADFVAHRDGRILSAFSLLKSDFFSGLQRMNLPERVEGAPNFRRVPLSASSATPDLSQSAASSLSTAQRHGPLVYGTGMPTVDGLRHALEKMGARETKILWQSLREEPVLFVAGRPHVLRLYDRPLENVITTGVTTATVEAMEVELKKDLLREREKTGGKVLLHDEIEENGTFTVTAIWEDVEPDAILTPREVYTIMQEEGFKVDYERLPVTDEQSPIPGVFSRIERRMSSALTARDKENFSAAWNCQMGRGRTTTGMVACALVYRILFERHAVFELAGSYIEPAEEHNVHWDGREAEPLLQGEYKLVLQLVGVLKNGKLAKRLADKAIDDMEAVQNLREAIFSFKLRVEAAEEGSKKRAKLFDQALNYLYRYATLIVFANFLLDKASHLDDLSEGSDADDEGADKPTGETEPDFPSFEDYLAQRPEIKKILTRRTLE